MQQQFKNSKEIQKQNPAYIIIKSQAVADCHGFMMNEVVPTTKKKIEWPDERGYEIRVHAPNLNKSIPLSAHEYEPIDAKGALANAVDMMEDITQKLRENFC